MGKIKVLIATGLVLLTGLAASADVSVGQSAPSALAMKTAAGTDITLADYKGKIVVLEWYNPDCPFVKKHYSVGNMQNLQKEFTDKGVVWLAVNSSAPGKQGALTASEANERMAQSKGAATAVVLDPSGTVGKAFGAKTTPHMFIVDKHGVVVFQGAIDDNDSARSSTIEGAKNFVRIALEELLAGKSVTTAQTEPYGCSVKY
jgi:alkyl hydroperoxide reductase subunit AhpC